MNTKRPRTLRRLVRGSVREYPVLVPPLTAEQIMLAWLIYRELWIVIRRKQSVDT